MLLLAVTSLLSACGASASTHAAVPKSRPSSSVAAPSTTATTDARTVGAPCLHPFVTKGEATTGVPTSAERAAAAALVTTTRDATLRYRDKEAAARAGYAPIDSLHWDNPAYRADKLVLDPSRPEELMYSDGRLVGAMYTTDDRPGPQIGGPLTVWHTHCRQRMPCVLANGRLMPAEAVHCSPQEQANLWMLHVWLVPNAGGQFAFEMRAPAAAP